jgi:hypothetical protein
LTHRQIFVLFQNCEELHDQITELQFQLKTVHHQLLQQQSMSRSLQTESRPKLEPKMTQTDADPNQDLEKLQRLSIEQLQQQKRDYEFQLEQLHHRHQLEVSSLQHAISNQEKVHSETLAQLQTQHRLAISSMQIEHNIALDQCALEQQTKARAWFESSLQRHTDTSQQQLNSSLQVAAERVRALETVISDLQSQLSSATPSASLNAVECASVEVQTELSVDKMTEPNSCNMQARGTNTDPLPEIAHPQPVTVPAKQDAFSTLLLKRAREECCQLKEANERFDCRYIELASAHTCYNILTYADYWRRISACGKSTIRCVSSFQHCNNDKKLQRPSTRLQPNRMSRCSALYQHCRRRHRVHSRALPD